MGTEHFVDVAFRVKAQRDVLLAFAYRALGSVGGSLGLDAARVIEVVERWRIQNGETTQASDAERRRLAADMDPLLGHPRGFDIPQPEENAITSMMLCGFCGAQKARSSCSVRPNGGGCIMLRHEVIPPGTMPRRLS